MGMSELNAPIKRERLVRKHLLLKEGTIAALQDLADEGRRPFSREVREVLERYVEAEAGRVE